MSQSCHHHKHRCARVTRPHFVASDVSEHQLRLIGELPAFTSRGAGALHALELKFHLFEVLVNYNQPHAMMHGEESLVTSPELGCKFRFRAERLIVSPWASRPTQRRNWSRSGSESTRRSASTSRPLSLMPNN